MRSRRVLVGTALLSVLLAGAGVASEATVQFVDVSDFPTTVITFTPPPEVRGTALTAGDVTLTQNGIAVPIVDLRALEADPVEAVLVIDTSGSMRGTPLSSAKNAAVEFVRILPEGSDLAVVAFGSTVEVVAEFGTDVENVEGAISSLVATGETSLYDAVVLGMDIANAGPRSRQFVVVLTDGSDTVSTATLDDATAALQTGEVGFYAIALQGSEFDPTPVAEMAAAANGVFVEAPTPTDLSDVYGEIASELISQYALTFEALEGGSSALQLVIDYAAGTIITDFEVDLPIRDSAGAVVGGAPSTTTIPPPEVSVEVTPIVKPPPTRVVATPGRFSTDAARNIGIGALGVVFLVAFLLALVPTGDGLPRRRGALDGVGAYGRYPSPTASLSRGRAVLRSVGERVASRGGSRSVDTALDAAGVALKSGEFMLITMGLVVIALLLGVAFGNLPLLAVLAILAVFGPRAWLERTARTRRAEFADQLEGTLQLIAGSLRAGYGVSQAINTVATESVEPTQGEFARVVVESRLGRDLDESLEALAIRMDNEDLRWVTDAIRIQREIGGNLAEVLDKVSATIRERNQIRRQVQALSAEGRFSAIILIALPIFLAGYLSIRSPEYLAELTESTTGQVMIGVAIVLMVLGILWIRRLVKIKF